MDKENQTSLLNLQLLMLDIEVVVLEIDKENRRLSLGHQQLKRIHGMSRESVLQWHSITKYCG